MKILGVSLLALGAALGGAAFAETRFVLVPTIVPGITMTKVEMLRSDTALSRVGATYVAEGTSGIAAKANKLKVYVGPSTSTKSPLLDLSPITPSGGMVILEPEQGLTAVEVSLEVEQAPIRTGWKLPLLAESDFFAPDTTIYVLNLIKNANAASQLQIFNAGKTLAICDVKVLGPSQTGNHGGTRSGERPGAVIAERHDLTVPALGLIRIPDLLRDISATGATGLDAAVTCNSPFYALGAFPDPNRWNTRVEFPVTQAPEPRTAVSLEVRPGIFFKVVQDNSVLNIPLALDPATTYHQLKIDLDIYVVAPSDFVVFRNVIGMFRKGGRRFGKTLYFGSFENFGASKYVVDLGTPYIETTLKRNFPLVGGHSYHFAVTLDNDEQSLRYVITEGASKVMDLLGGLYNRVETVGGNQPTIQVGLPGVADNAYYPPYRWRFSNLRVVATK